MNTIDFYQHLLTSYISTFSPTKALSHHGLSQAAHRELSVRKKCVRLWHRMDLIPAFGLIYLALGVIVKCETLKVIHQKSDQHFTGVVTNKPIPVSICLTPDLIQGNASPLICDWVLQALNIKIHHLNNFFFCNFKTEWKAESSVKISHYNLSSHLGKLVTSSFNYSAIQIKRLLWHAAPQLHGATHYTEAAALD